MTQLKQIVASDYVKQIKKIQREMKKNEIYWPYLKGKNFHYVEQLNDLARKQLDLLHDYDTFDIPENKKIWEFCIDLNNDCREMLELKEFAEIGINKELIIQEVKLTSNYTGLHGQYNAYYIENDELKRIFIRSISGFSDKTKHYHKHGGNYSFRHDLVCDISLIVSEKYDFFTYREI